MAWALLILIIIFISSILLLILLPFFAIIECAISENVNSSKIVWLTIIFLSWTIGAGIYSFFFTKSKKLRIFAVLTIIPVSIGLSVALYFYITNPEFRSELLQKVISQNGNIKKSVTFTNYQNLNNLSANNTISDDNFEEQIELIKAQTELYKKNYSVVLDKVNSMLSQNSKNSEALLLRAKVFNELHKTKESNIDLNKVLEIENANLTKNTEDTKALSRRSSAYLLLKQYDQALDDLREIQRITPNDELIALRIKSLEAIKSL
jgi:tetratricopeptide (TPR) repeat protein